MHRNDTHRHTNTEKILLKNDRSAEQQPLHESSLGNRRSQKSECHDVRQAQPMTMACVALKQGSTYACELWAIFGKCISRRLCHGERMIAPSRYFVWRQQSQSLTRGQYKRWFELWSLNGTHCDCMAEDGGISA